MSYSYDVIYSISIRLISSLNVEQMSSVSCSTASTEQLLKLKQLRCCSGSYQL